MVNNLCLTVMVAVWGAKDFPSQRQGKFFKNMQEGCFFLQKNDHMSRQSNVNAEEKCNDIISP